MKLKIANIFYSIQGEGKFIGTPSVFVRFFDCNLSCSFCDDLDHKKGYKEYSYNELLQKISKYPSKHLIITGGEPSIYELNPFIEVLQDNDYFVAIETNGFKFENVQKADWITYSPKNWDEIKPNGFSEIKFVVNSSSKVQKILEFQTDKQIYIQPQNNMDTTDMGNMKFCIELVQNNPKLKLSPQLHKLLEIE
jgi:7-carboxy-7-deazaguanine synthase